MTEYCTDMHAHGYCTWVLHAHGAPHLCPCAAWPAFSPYRIVAHPLIAYHIDASSSSSGEQEVGGDQARGGRGSRSRLRGSQGGHHVRGGEAEAESRQVGCLECMQHWLHVTTLHWLCSRAKDPKMKGGGRVEMPYSNAQVQGPRSGEGQGARTEVQPGE